MFEGDRRFQIVVRLSDAERNNVEVLKNLPVALPETTPGAGATMVPLRQLAEFPVFRRPESDQPGQRQAARRRDGERARSRHGLSRRRGASQNIRTGEAAARILAGLGRAIREPRLGAAKAPRRRAGLLCPDIFVAAGLARVSTGRAAGFQRGAAGAHRRRIFPVAARYDIFDFVGGRVHRLVGCRSAQRPGDADLHPAIDRRGRAACTRGHLSRDAHAPATGGHDRAGRLAGLRADGGCDRHRRRGAEAAGDRRHRRPDQHDVVDPAGSAGALRTFLRNSNW